MTLYCLYCITNDIWYNYPIHGATEYACIEDDLKLNKRVVWLIHAQGTQPDMINFHQVISCVTDGT